MQCCKLAAHVALVAVLAVASTPAARAQSTFLDLSPQTSPVVTTALSNVGTSAMSYYTHGAGVNRTSLADALAAPPHAATAQAPDAAALGTLTFAPSPGVTQDTNRQIVAALAAHVPAANRGKLEQLVASGELPRAFDGLLGKFGYNPDDLGDVMTAYIIIAWETIHDGDATRFPRGMEAVRQRVRDAMATNPHTATLSDAQKQNFAEVLAYMAMLDVVGRKRLQASGDAAGLRQLEQNVRAQTRGYGLDLGALQLTDRGFVVGR